MRTRVFAFSRARKTDRRVGTTIDTSRPMIAMTVSSSISVKPPRRGRAGASGCPSL